MKNYKVEEKPQKTLESITCDVCNKTYAFTGDEVFEAQEFLSIDTEGGFGSIFGDMNKIQLDVCQHCFKKKFEDCIRISDGYFVDDLDTVETEYPDTEVIFEDENV